jgi:hypothetical protein
MPVSTQRDHSPWLLLAFGLPAKNGSKRVEIWRKLKKFGALPLPSSGYLLPHTPANQEHFEWLAASIRKYRGHASVIQVQAIDGFPDEQIIQRFKEARSREYEQLIRDLRSKKGSAQTSRIRRRFQETVAIDFFDSPLRSRVEGLLLRAEAGEDGVGKTGTRKTKKNKEFLNRKWLTRPRPGIDRVSSAWLIQKFIDASAQFIFDSDETKHPDAVPFDMFHGGGFGHRDDDCTFETLTKEFRIIDPKVIAIAQVIHDADLSDEKFGRIDGIGLDHVLIGWAQMGISDEELLRRGMELIEGLYHSLS